MKIDKVPGEFGFKAAFCIAKEGLGWDLSKAYYFSYEEARKSIGPGFIIKWPVEIDSDGFVYIPPEEELQ